MAAPLQQFAGLLQALPRNFAYGLKALLDERGGAPETEAAEEAEATEATEATEETEDTETPAAEPAADTEES
jgi:hypothetical protein